MISTWHEREHRVSKIQFRTEKHCSRCKECKPIEEFCGDKSRKDGRDVYCKICRILIRPYVYKSPDQRKLKADREKLCHERLAFWTNELNKIQKENL